jgi:hypothetical protein
VPLQARGFGVHHGPVWIFWSVVAMIRPVIPGRTEHRPTNITAPPHHRPLPLPTVPVLPPRRTCGTVYRIAALDNRGRISHRVILETLGWTEETALDVFLLLGRVIFRPAPAGANLISPQGRLTLPLNVRRALRLRTGDRVLLAADPAEHELAALPEALLDQLLDGGDRT